MEDIKNIIDKFSSLNDLEFEILFVDAVAKKLKSLDKSNIRTETLLFLYFSIVETLKKFKFLANEGNRIIPYIEYVDLIISKCDAYLSSVTEENNKALYVQQSLSDTNELVKGLLFSLKKDLVDTPEYEHLKPH